MKHILSLTTALAVLALLTSLASDTAFAQTNGKQFGKTAMQQYGPFDDDGDGIPNGQDPDYVKPKNGTGHQFGKSNGGSKMNGVGKGNGYGPGNGTGNQALVRAMEVVMAQAMGLVTAQVQTAGAGEVTKHIRLEPARERVGSNLSHKPRRRQSNEAQFNH